MTSAERFRSYHRRGALIASAMSPRIETGSNRW
jgi:hypothetical protein